MAASDPHPEWIEKVVKLAGALGMNPTRVRWKLVRWHENRRRANRRLEQKLDHVRYEHKTCHECGAVADREATECTRCGARLGRRGFQVLRRLGIFAPEALSTSTLLALAMLAVYMRVIAAQGGGIGTPSGALLFDLGAQWPLGSDDAWRLVTAMFLHIGLLHLAFNLIAIASIGPRIEELYGRTTMIFLFVATGVLANVGSGLVQPAALSAGASGGVCGLIGAAAGYGQRLGTARGRTLRNDMLKWLAYTIIFGFGLHANNWAHAFGALAGGAFGFAVRVEVWTRAALRPLRAIAAFVGAAAAIFAVAMIFTRTPVDRRDEGASTYRFEAEVCRLYLDGATSGARALYAVRNHAFGMDLPPEIDPLYGLCDALLDTRDQCRSGRLDGEDLSPEMRGEVCGPIEDAFGAFPEHARRRRP